MISKENKSLVGWAMDYALKSGCSEVKLALYEGKSTNIMFRDRHIDTLEQASETVLGMQLYVEGKYGVYSTNRLSQKEIALLIKQGVNATKFLAPDDARVLPNPDRYYTGGLPDLKLYDYSYDEISPDQKLYLAKKMADEVLGQDKRVISVTSSYSDGLSSTYQLFSNGFEGELSRSRFNLSSSVSIQGIGESKPSDFWYDSALKFKELNPDGIGVRALDRALSKIGQKKIKTGVYTMVLDRLCASRLLSPLINALYGSALQYKNSFLENKLNEKVGSSLLTLYDTPHIVGANGARYFDGEGVATQDRSIFYEGVLKGYFIDTYSSLKLGLDPTISAPSLLQMKTGDKNLNELIMTLSSGILVTGINGGNSNGATGDFSFGIEGYYIEQGKIEHPISEMNITGNLIDLWGDLVGVGNDPILSSSWRIPSLVFKNVSFSGL